MCQFNLINSSKQLVLDTELEDELISEVAKRFE